MKTSMKPPKSTKGRYCIEVDENVKVDETVESAKADGEERVEVSK